MTSHIGFRVFAAPPRVPFISPTVEVENFEVRQAAIDCAQLLESRGWRDIRCVHVTSRIKQFETDSCEEFADVEWQCHFVGSTS